MVRTYGGGIYEQFTNLFIPKAISEEHIPKELRQAVAARLGGANRKWYAAAPEGDTFFSAVDYVQDDPPVRLLHLALWQDSGDSLPCPVAEVAVPVRFDEPFGGAPQAPDGVCAGDRGQVSQAVGWAWDRRVTSVVGFTGSGDKVQGKPVNGCWLLVSKGDPVAGWREFRALDRRGRVLYGCEV